MTAVLSLCGVVAMTYPDTPAAPREFEGGLERELGGPNAVRVSIFSSPNEPCLTGILGKSCWR